MFTPTTEPILFWCQILTRWLCTGFRFVNLFHVSGCWLMLLKHARLCRNGQVFFLNWWGFILNWFEESPAGKMQFLLVRGAAKCLLATSKALQGSLGSLLWLCRLHWQFSTPLRVVLLYFLQLSLCRSHCSGCVKVARCRGCMRNTIVFCSWTS